MDNIKTLQQLIRDLKIDEKKLDKCRRYVASQLDAEQLETLKDISNLVEKQRNDDEIYEEHPDHFPLASYFWCGVGLDAVLYEQNKKQLERHRVDKKKKQLREEATRSSKSKRVINKLKAHTMKGTPTDPYDDVIESNIKKSWGSLNKSTVISILINH